MPAKPPLGTSTAPLKPPLAETTPAAEAPDTKDGPSLPGLFSTPGDGEASTYRDGEASTYRDVEIALAGRYTLIGEIGRGGMATVFRAYDERNGRDVAIKVMHPALATTLGSHRFLQEISIAARLQHPHIIALFESGQVAGLPFYVMPFIDGISLRGRLELEGQLSVDGAISIARDVADALDYAHAQGVVHRDVKPENILLEGRNAALGDFGVARAMEVAAGQRLTDSGVAVGTVAYMSPEQAAGSVSIDGRSDVYGLACVFYEMLAGEPPFTGPTPQAVVAKHMQSPVPDLRVVRSIVPPEMQRVLEVALAKVPADRFARAGDFVDALESSRSLGAALAQKKRQRTALAAVVGLVIFLVVFGRDRREAAQLRRGDVAAPPRIAVLYFDDLSRDSSLSHIADGVTEELIHELSGVNAFRVVSRNGVKQYRGKRVAFDSMVRALQVNTVVDGSVQKNLDRIEVLVQLIDAQSSTHVDRLALSRPLSNMATLERDVAREVATALRRRLGRTVLLRGAVAGSTNQRAKELVLKARRARDDAELLAEQPHPDDLRTAVQALGRSDSLLALAKVADPRWIRPVIDRGWTAYQRSKLQSGKIRAATLEQALLYADEAARRDPTSAAALELRGTIHWQLVTELEAAPADPERMRKAEADLRAAVDRDSTLAVAWANLSYLLSVKGSFGEAALAAESALREDAYLEGARDVFVQLFYGALMLADFGQAGEWCRRGRLSRPNDWRFIECELTLMRHDAGRPPNPERAWALVAELERIDPAEKGKAAGREYNSIYRRVVAATISARAGRHDIARTELARAIRATQGQTSLRLDLAYDEAYLRLVLGERQRAERLLDELLEARPVLRAQLLRDPLFRDLTAGP